MATLNVQRGPLAFVDRTLDTLSPRDRKLLVAMILFFVAVATFGYWYSLQTMLQGEASRVVEAKRVYQAVLDSNAELKRANAQFASQEVRLRRSSQIPVTAWVENLAKEHQLDQQLAKVTPDNAEAVGSIVQTHYTVELKKAPQEALYRFLYALETSDFPASVNEARFKVTMVKKEKLLDCTLDIVVLSAVEG